jgi:hypothetical protein
LTLLVFLNKLNWKYKSGHIAVQQQLKMQTMWILVVEDDPTTSVLREKALREEGHTVVVENGAARRRALPNARAVRAGCVRCVRRRLADEEKTIKNC